MPPDPPSDPVSLYLHVPADLRDEHRAHLADAARAVRAAHPGLAVVEELYEGSSSNGLIALATSAELVVIGTHRRGALAGFLYGSVGRELLHYCSTPLCVVPSPDGAPGATVRADRALA